MGLTSTTSAPVLYSGSGTYLRIYPGSQRASLCPSSEHISITTEWLNTEKGLFVQGWLIPALNLSTYSVLRHLIYLHFPLAWWFYSTSLPMTTPRDLVKVSLVYTYSFQKHQTTRQCGWEWVFTVSWQDSAVKNKHILLKCCLRRFSISFHPYKESHFLNSPRHIPGVFRTQTCEYA